MVATNNMKQNQHYESPAILRVVVLRTRGAILGGSVQDHSTVTTMGQEVKDYDFTSDNNQGFNHSWED